MATDPNIITYYRGDSYPKVVTLTDKKTKAVVDLTGASFKLTVGTEKDPVDDTNQLFQIVGIIDDDPLLGLVSFTPSAANTDQVPGKYWYDIEMTVGAIVRTVVKSNFIITMDIGK